MLTGDLSSPAFASFATSLVFALILGLGWGGIIVGMFVRAARLAKLQAHENAYRHERATWRLSEGPSRVVHGRVQVDGPLPGTDVAIEVDIHQTVQDHTSKNSRWHVWQESLRRTQARPFKLDRDDGQVVSVEPGNDVFVVDALSTEYPNDQPRRRLRAARVRHGEDVFVYGELRAAPSVGVYRGGATFVLGPPRGGRLLVATEAMQERYRARVGFLRRAGMLLVACFCVVQLMMAPFTAALLFGKQETAALTNVRQYVTYGKHGAVHHYALTATMPDGFSLEQEVEWNVFSRASTAYNHRQEVDVPVLRTGTSTWASFLGTDPELPIPVLIFSPIIALLSTLAALTRYPNTTAWYDRKRLNEHGGAGHWIESRTVNGTGQPIAEGRN